MRVALLIKTNEGGLWTLPQIDELRSRGHEVTVVLPAGNGRLRQALDAHRVPVVESEFAFRFAPRLSTMTGLLRLRRQLAALAPDVVFYHLYASALAARIATARLGVARVHMVAGPLYLESAVIRAAERWLVRLDTVTIGGSDFTARCYRELGRSVDVTPAIPYGVDTTVFRPTDERVGCAVRAELGVDDAAFVVVMVALVYGPKRSVHRGRGIKGHDVLLDAWTTFQRRHPGSHLIIVGGGFDESGEIYRAQLMERYGLPADGRGITWLSTGADVRRYYAAANLSVSPSLSENHGAALEAGAMGVPSIVSDAGALPETVGPGTGWVVPRQNVPALVAALEVAHAEHRTGVLPARGLRAREFMEHRFDRRATSSAVVDVIESVGREPDESAHHRVHSVFCEARFGRDPQGVWAGVDGAGGWGRYLRNGSGLRVVARADSRIDSASVPLPPGLELFPLPYYVGVRQLGSTLFPLVVSVARAVRDAESIILRLPGVIGSLGAAACVVLRRRYAVEVIGDPREVLAAGVLGGIGRLLASAAAIHMRWVARRADAVLYVTTETLQRRYPARHGSVSIGVSDVVLGADAFAAGPRRSHAGCARVVTIGTQEQSYKGHDVLIRAIGCMLDNGLDVTATIVGGGRTHLELRRLVTSLGLGERVTLTGMINDRSCLVALLDEATVFAMPSRTEGLPRALVEAMARGLPAVGSAVGGIPELLDARWIVPPDDHRALGTALADLLGDPMQWEEQSRRNLDIAHTFHVDDLRERFDNWLINVPDATASTHRRRDRRTGK